MKKILILAAMALTLAACNNASNAGESNDEQQQPVKKVEGRKNFGPAHAVITPQPCIMIATYDKNNNPDVMMAAWAGQALEDAIEFNLSSHQTTDNLKLKKAFTVSFATEADMAQSDYMGIVSARNVPDKVKRAGFHVMKSPNVDAPIITDYKLTLECRVVKMEEVENETHVVGKIVNWSADPSILDAQGRVDLSKLKPIIYDSGAMIYRAVGDSVGAAWNSGKKFQ